MMMIGKKTTIFFSPTKAINLRNLTFYNFCRDALVSKIYIRFEIAFGQLIYAKYFPIGAREK